MRKKVPNGLQKVLWSYNIESMDLEEDKELIIQQVLNYGNWEDLRWLYQTYPEMKIRKVVQNPRRGMWFENVLNFWCLMLKIRLPKRVREQAIFHIEPRFQQWQYLFPEFQSKKSHNF
jgi:hypothetical protein